MLTHFLLFISPPELRCICSSELSHHTFPPVFTTDSSLALEGLNKSAPNSISLMKDKISASRNVEHSYREQDAPKSARFGMFPTALTPTFPGHTEIPNGELSPNSSCPVDSNKSPGESFLLHHTRRQNLHMCIQQ